MKNAISRRNLLKGAGIGALSLGLGAAGGVQRILAQTSPTAAQISAFYRTTLGDFNITIVNDTTFALPPSTFGANAAEEDLAAAVDMLNLPAGNLKTVVDIMVLQNGDRTILMDTGTGSNLNPTLEAIGISQDSVTDVVITHFHGDHVGGVSFDGELAYPNAQHYISQTELDFLMMMAEGDEIPDAVAGALAKLQPGIDAGTVSTYSDGDEVVPGVTAVAAPGHTPGHHAMMVSSGGGSILNMVDTALNAYLSVGYPDWFAGFDGDGEIAAATRRELLGMAASEQMQVFGYHFPFPGIGYIAAAGDGYRFSTTG